tara:strand:- start:580 stop:2037 length:1458 start_codon:yes stop_codon:yes gene_type:complete
MKLLISKKGNIIVPLFIFLSQIGISYANLFVQDIISPIRFPSLDHVLTSESIQMYYNSDIGLEDEKNFINISYYDAGIKTQYKFKSLLMNINFKKENSNFKFGENLYSLNYRKWNQLANTRMLFNYNKTFIPLLSIGIDRRNHFSYGYGAGINIKSKLKLFTEYRVSPSNYLLELIYNNFLFSHIVTQLQKTSTSSVKYTHNFFDIDFLKINKIFEVDETTSDNLEQDFQLNSRKDQILKTNLTFKINSINHIQTTYIEKDMVLSLNITNTVIKPNGIEDVAELINIDSLSYNSIYKTISYNRIKANTNFKIGTFQKDIFIYDISRLRPKLIDDEFVEVWGCFGFMPCTIVNNDVKGIIKSRGAFINFKKQINDKTQYIINNIFLKDNYNINSINTLVGGPQSISILNYTYREAIVFGLGFNHKFNKITLGTIFNQHIPIKINYLDVEDESDSDNSNNNENINTENKGNKKYGGGSLKILLSIKI